MCNNLPDNYYETLALAPGKLERAGLHPAIRRNTVRILQHIDIPVEYHGAVMNICFQYVESPSEPVAVKAFSLTVLGKLAKSYPDILPELKLLIETQIQQQTPAFRVRATKLLKEFG